MARFGDQISFEYRHFPVISGQSPKAAEAGQCAAEQGAFWEYHDYIYEQAPPNALGIADLELYATAIGLDNGRFSDCLDSDKYRDFVNRDWRAALDVGARGTPSFYIDGRQVAPGFEAMAATIEQLLES